MPRCTVTPSCGTSANLMVLFGPDQIASERSLPTFVLVDVERRHELDVADVVAAEVDVHQTGDEVVLARRRGSSGRPGRAKTRSCRRR